MSGSPESSAPGPAGGGSPAAVAPRVLGLLPAWALVAGSMLGVGIYLTPGLVARETGGLGGFLGLWAAGGLFALGGAVAYAELGTMMPQAGGDYAYLRRAFGPALAFAAGWVLLAAIFAGSLATMAAGLWTYQLSTLFGVSFSEVQVAFGVTAAQLGALALIVALTALNSAGALVSGRTQSILTSASIVVVLGLVGVALARGGSVPSSAPVATPTFGGLAAAYMGVYFAYAGWNNVSYVAGEVREPGRNLPRALIGGVLVITALYVVMALSFAVVLGVSGVAASGDAGAATAERLAGRGAQLALAALIGAAIVACINASVCAGARIGWAMARDGALWSAVGTLGQRGAPVRALWLQAAMAAALVLTGTFDRLLELASLAMILIGCLTVAALFVLRRRLPDAPRPYRASGYPWLPLTFLVSGALASVGMLLPAVRGQPGAWYPFLGIAVLFVAWGARAFTGRREVT